MAIVEGNRLRVAFLEPRLRVAGGPEPIFAEEDAPQPKPRHVVLEHPNPHLPDLLKIARRGDSLTEMAKLCVGSDGRVAEITPEVPIQGANGSMMRVLKTWRYASPMTPACFYGTWLFTIDP